MSLVDLEDLVVQEAQEVQVDLEPTLEYLVQVHPVEALEDLVDHLKAVLL